MMNIMRGAWRHPSYVRKKETAMCRDHIAGTVVHVLSEIMPECVLNFFSQSTSSADVSRIGLAVRLVSGRSSVRYRFGSPFPSKRLWFVDTVL